MEKQKSTAVAKTGINFSQTGIVKFKDFNELGSFCESYAKSDAAMKCYQDKPANAIVAVMYGYELGMEPITSLNNIYIINNRPALFAECIHGLVKSSKVCEYVHFKYIGTEYDDDFGVQVTSKRKDDTEPLVSQFTVADAKKANLWGNRDSWVKYPKRLLFARSLSFNLQDNFPDITKGIKTYEVVADYEEVAETKSLNEVMDDTLKKLDDDSIAPESQADIEAEKEERNNNDGPGGFSKKEMDKDLFNNGATE